MDLSAQITRIEALNYRCLRYINQSLDPFHVLVGPNASGKTTFLDVVAFLGRLVSDGIDVAIEERTETNNFQDLTWGRNGDKIELAIEVKIPEFFHSKFEELEAYKYIRYEVGLWEDSRYQQVVFSHERVLLMKPDNGLNSYRESNFFPNHNFPPDTLAKPKSSKLFKTILNKNPERNDNFYGEISRGWKPSFKLGPRKSALGSLPADESMVPVTSWFRDLLISGVQKIVLNSRLMQKPSPPGKGKGFLPDGSNLPWVVQSLDNHQDSKQEWILHLQTALGDLKEIRVVDRQEDRHKYLMIKYMNGLEIPSWVASDGTLRLLALTLPAYLPDFSGVYLIEEPENGIHPKAVETVFQSLSSVYNAQILLATHSPVILSMVEPRNVLCFAKTDTGQTDIIRGDEHPALKSWRGDTDLGVLYAGGVLG